jgi:hypothetical protein
MDFIVRIVQYKMILKQDLIPTQGDPENGKVPGTGGPAFGRISHADIGSLRHGPAPNPATPQ